VDEWETSAFALAQVDAGQPDRSFYDATVDAAEAIIADLVGPLDALTDRLVAEGEMDEAASQEALSITPLGSHRYLVGTLI
jgi:hypothetical protein